MKPIKIEAKEGSSEEEIYHDIWHIVHSSSKNVRRIIAGLLCDPPTNGWGYPLIISDDKEYVKIYRNTDKHIWCAEASSREFLENVLTILTIALR